MDYAKAFDKVDHGLLGLKLKEIGIHGNVAKWLESFLANRTQRVRIDNTMSKEQPVVSGVPQGTVLGPLLFLILINDISDELQEGIKTGLFADDTRVSSVISNTEDVDKLQMNLNMIYRWQELYNMEFNSDKFELMRVGNNAVIKEETLYFTNNYEDNIERKETLRDLGVQMQENMTFTEHISKVTSKVRSKTSWILRTMHSRSPELMRKVWKSFILPNIDYCSVLWFSMNKPVEILNLERAQNYFLKRVTYMDSLNYWERLRQMKMMSIQRRLERYIILYTWKATEGLVQNFGLEWNINSHRNRILRVPALKRATCKTKTISDGTIQVTGPKLFNSLPDSLRNISVCSPDIFKMCLDSFLSLIPDEPKLDQLIPHAINQITGKHSNCLIDMITHNRNIVDSFSIGMQNYMKHTVHQNQLNL